MKYSAWGGAFFGFFLVSAFFGNPAFASITNGTINSIYKFAWGDALGWVNFAASSSNVTIDDSKITGFAWSANYGWINLAPAKSGVKNDGEGHLSGDAWSTSFGWIDFKGVVINPSGVFTGSTVPGSAGTINFDCKHCKVVTDWAPQSARITHPNGSEVGPYFPPPPGPPPFPVPVRAGCSIDFDNDQRVDIVDLSILLYYYGQTGPAVRCYDLNSNGTVDFPDISILMFYWTNNHNFSPIAMIRNFSLPHILRRNDA